ncbi:MAG: amidophosphoribosyltransferase, partial [Gammaproteobacteria bacterium]|nr:amidophosphoribosyltransferase [Gammaproteobacteria bacterium]
DWLVYQDLDDLIDAAREGNPAIKKFDCAVFDGKYVTGDVDQAYLEQLHLQRNDLAKISTANKLAESSSDTELVDLYNDIS